MAQLLYRIGVGGNSLLPALPGYPWRTVAAAFGPSLNILAGQAVARKTSTGRFFPFNPAASDGTQTFAGFSQYSGGTDANGQWYMTINASGGASPDFLAGGGVSAPSIVTSGVVDPYAVYTQNAANTSATAEVDTATPTGTVTAGDTWGIFQAGTGVGVEVIANATATVAAIITQMKNAWNDDAASAALATATSSSTVLTLTAVNAGVAMNLVSSSTAASSFLPVYVVATPAAGGVQAEVYNSDFTGTVATGDVYSVTINYPNLSTYVVTAPAVGATQTATAAALLMKNAWNADPTASAYAVATVSGANFILTSAVPGNTMSLTIATTGAGTFTNSVTTAAFGRNIADITPSRPGAYILEPQGFWVLP